jgi:hypothetical protein
MEKVAEAEPTAHMLPDRGGAEIVAVTDEAGSASYEALRNVSRVVTQRGSELADELGVSMTPFGMAVDREGTVRTSRLLATFDDVAALAASAVTTTDLAVHRVS